MVDTSRQRPPARRDDTLSPEFEAENPASVPAGSTILVQMVAALTKSQGELSEAIKTLGASIARQEQN
jgi:hypothetical protein